MYKSYPRLSPLVLGLICFFQRSITLRFHRPEPPSVGKLIIDLDASPGLSKTRTNFLALCSGEKGYCKNAPNKKLHYNGCPIHRVVKGFVMQGGDVTRGDGSGGQVRIRLRPFDSFQRLVT